MSELIFLKLGGSLITDKFTPTTARQEVLARLASEIAAAHSDHKGMQLIIGHGSGSFGHPAAAAYNTRAGVHTPEDWIGYAKVWYEARMLNNLVLQALHAVDLPVIAFPASASITAHNGQENHWDLIPLRAALKVGLIPLVYGDVVFDEVRGGTILSTEDLFSHLAKRLYPNRILIAGIEAGVWEDYPTCTTLIKQISPAHPLATSTLQGSAALDVTGGMAEKVRILMDLVEQNPSLKGMIFSGESAGAVQRALLGEDFGTIIQMD